MSSHRPPGSLLDLQQLQPLGTQQQDPGCWALPAPNTCPCPAAVSHLSVTMCRAMPCRWLSGQAEPCSGSLKPVRQKQKLSFLPPSSGGVWHSPSSFPLQADTMLPLRWVCLQAEGEHPPFPVLHVHGVSWWACIPSWWCLHPLLHCWPHDPCIPSWAAPSRDGGPDPHWNVSQKRCWWLDNKIMQAYPLLCFRLLKGLKAARKARAGSVKWMQSPTSNFAA